MLAKAKSVHIYNENFSKNCITSIQAFIFRPRAPKFRVVVRYVEVMV